ncbi:zinc-binding dehydrogenase [Streptomyces sp. ZAF1911]|uniref:zinc-binding dehydrogenase n=1 Tax=Streptomyces sp. ZAF1911 TaxID=2944129 RepID=UPI003FD062B1
MGPVREGSGPTPFGRCQRCGNARPAVRQGRRGGPRGRRRQQRRQGGVRTRPGRQLWELRDAGTLRTSVHEEIPLAEAARAHAVIEQRRNLGKVVLVP